MALVISGTAREILEVSERIKRGEFDQFKPMAMMPGTFAIIFKDGRMNIHLAHHTPNKVEIGQMVYN